MGDSANTNPAIEIADDLLGALAKNKAQQLCKSTIHLCLEFILAIFTLVTTIQSEAAQQVGDSYDDSGNDDGDRRIGGAGKGNVPTSVYGISSLAALWAIFLALGMLSSMFKKRHYSTIKEVEDVFSHSNKIPFVEAFYGMYLCKKYTNPASRAFPRACVLWIVYLILLFILFYLVSAIPTSTATLLTSLQIALQLFRISSDITEYLARTNLDEQYLHRSGSQMSTYATGAVRVESTIFARLP